MAKLPNQKQIPDPEMFERSAECFREVCRKLDALNLVLDDAIAQMDAMNREHFNFARPPPDA